MQLEYKLLLNMATTPSQELSTVEGSRSGAIGEYSNAAVCLDEHKEQTASDLCDSERCILMRHSKHWTE